MTRPHVEKEGSSRCAGCDHTFGQHDLSPLAAEAAKHGMPGPCLYGFGTWMRCECHGFRSEQPAAPSPREDWKRGAERDVNEAERHSVEEGMTQVWPAPSRGAEADEAAAREWLMLHDRFMSPRIPSAEWITVISALASFRAQARREAAEAMRDALGRAATLLAGVKLAKTRITEDWAVWAEIDAHLPGIEALLLSLPHPGAEREVEGYPMCASCGQPKVNHAGGLYCPTKDGRTFSPATQEQTNRDRDNYPKDARHWREQPPEPRRIGGRTRVEWAMWFDWHLNSDTLRDEDEAGTLTDLLSAAFSEPSR